MNWLNLRQFLPLLVVGILSHMPMAASAQMDWITPHLQSLEFGRQIDQIVEQSRTGGATQQQAAPVDASFTPSAARTQDNVSRFIRLSEQAGDGGQLRSYFVAQPTLMGEIAQAMRGANLDPQNVADCYALWWMAVWQAANGVTGDPDSRTVAAVRRQARDVFATTPGFAETSDADRQQYAEALMLQTLLLSAANEQFQGNPAALRQLASSARQGAVASGVDISRMTLTSDGFVMSF